MNSDTIQECSTNALTACNHCGQSIVFEYKDESGNLFCCNGCKSVFHLLKDNGLEDYYKYRKDSDVKPTPTLDNEQNFTHFDSDSFQRDYINLESDHTKSMHFYLEGIHCIACLWLIEKLPQLDRNIVSSRLNLSTSTVKVVIRSDYFFGNVASLLNKLGYKPYPVKDRDEQSLLIRKEDRSLMLKIGIAGAASMNVMIYQVGIFGGAEGVFAHYFNLINLALTIPVFFYSATPFHLNAIRNIKSKTISIDLPISIGISLAFFVGILNTYLGHPDNYFDSICVLVFLLLSSRYILRKAQHRSFNKLGLINLLKSVSVTRITSDGKEEIVAEGEIKVGDVIRCKLNDVIPVDGKLISNKATLNLASLTGESAPVSAPKGTIIFAGSILLNENAEIEVQQTGSETRIGKIYQEIEQGWNIKAPISNWADRISKYLVISVLSIAAIDFLYWTLQGQWHQGLNRALALIIITCPCALGLATPLAFIRALSIAAQRNILVKNESVIERLTHAKTFVFDKTGTLTQGRYVISSIDYLVEDKIEVLRTLLTLEWNSKHPIAKAVKEYVSNHLEAKYRIPFENSSVFEVAAFGVKAIINQKEILLTDEGNDSNQKVLSLFADGQLLAKVYLNDELKADASATIAELKKKNLKVAIVSGDSESQVAKVGKLLNIDASSRYSKISPELKNECLNHFESPVMIGDGANDALALSHSLVGISLQGSVEASLRASDIHIGDSKLIKVIEILDISTETLKVVKRNLAFSLLYNAVGLVLALAGIINPLWGAIIMPISSLTVLLSTLFGTKKLRQLGNIL